MRIEKIRLRNLASLEGEWEIDLTDPAYARSGIFAITGATGAGKTTIFDAIRLALFRRTSRLESFAMSNEIMTRGTAECFAKLQFSLAGRRYVASWSQSRSRGKADGRLQPDRHTLEEVMPDGSLRLLAEQRKQTEKQILDLLKMDFDHFSRAMLLPQGEFAIFLKTPAAERSEILEQITGSTVYKRISAEAYAKYRGIQETLDLEAAGAMAIEVIPPEEVASLESQKMEKSENASRFTALSAALLRINDLSDRVRSARTELLALAAETEAAAPALAAARSATAEAAANAAELRSRREAERPAIAAARAFDESIRLAESELRSSTELIQKEESALHSAAQELKALEVAAAETEKTQECARAVLDAHPEDVVLPENFAAWSAKLDDYEAMQTQLESLCRNCRQREAALAELHRQRSGPEEALQRLDIERDKLSEQKQKLDAEYDELSGVASETREDFRLNTALRCRRIRELIESAGRLSSGHLRLGRLGTEKQQLMEQNVRAHAELEQLEPEFRELEPLFRIPDFAAERAHLRDGTPCPLCGAPHHPYASAASPDETDRLHKRYLSVSEELQSIRLRLFANAGELRRIDEQRIELAAALAQEAALLNTKLPPEWKLSADDPELINSLEKKGITCEQQQAAAERFDRESRELGSALEALETDIRLRRQEQTAAEHRIALAALALDEAGKREAELRERLQKAGTELAEILTPFGCSPAEARLCLAGRLERFREASARAETAAKHLARLSGEQASCRDFLKRRQERINELMSTQAIRQKQLADLQSKRAALLGGRSADAVEEEREAACSAASIREREAAARLRELEEAQVVRDTRRESAAQRLAELLAELGRSAEDGRTREERAAEAAKLREEARLLNEESGAIAQKLRHDASERERRRAAENRLDRLRQETARWRLLNELIGKQDGGKFQQFAQSLIFEQLIARANLALRRFSDRYELVSIEDSPLDFNVIDHYQCDEIRSVKNLSGGESFLVSMSLALALSRMSGEHLRIDTLFLDEGFGTLDEETLSHVLSQIQSLQSEGKLVGIITHVPNIEAFVPLQIRLTPAEKSGRSRISGIGVKSL
ncbi:MAG: AAA family ATPase [Lentisphaeria bacterium]|nr:AAA family ATPase [Lentisphaeria bacterium]